MGMNGIPGMVRRNLTGAPMRSLALILLAGVMGTAWFAGLILVPCVRSGLVTVQRRLGADIMVVPYAALSKKSYENELLLGSVVPVYMPGENQERIRQIEGVSGVSSQVCMGDVPSELADSPVHLMGYDPQTDFCVMPWVKERVPEPADMPAAVVGAGIRAEAGDTIPLLSDEVFVAGQMEETGTDLDTSIYIDAQELLRMVDASGDTDLAKRADAVRENQVSAILVEVAKGYDPEPVLNSINIHIKKVRAIVSEQVIGGEASSIHGVAVAVQILAIVAGCAAMAAYAIVYFLMTSERKKEFALYRAQGASRKMLSALVVSENVVLSIGAGVICAAILPALLPALISAAGNAMHISISQPVPGQVVLCSAAAIGISALAGIAGALIMAHRISRQDASSALREA